MSNLSINQEGIKDALNSLFRINLRKLINLLEKDGFTKDEKYSETYGLTYTKALDLTVDGDEEGMVQVTFSNRKYDGVTVNIKEEGFEESDYFVIKDLSKKTDVEIVNIFKTIKSKVERTDRPSPNSSEYKAYMQQRDARRALEEKQLRMQRDKKNLKHNTMKFDEMINSIAELTVPVGDAAFATEARPANPELQKWKKENPGKPVYLFYKAQRAKKAGTASARAKKAGTASASSVVTPVPTTTGIFKELPDTKRTKEAVANILQYNPDATFEEVMEIITSKNTAETPLNLDPEVVKTAMSDPQTAISVGDEDPDIESLRKSELEDRYNRMRHALSAAHGLKAKPGRRATPKEPFADIGDEDDMGFDRRSINMRDEPIDPNEL